MQTTRTSKPAAGTVLKAIAVAMGIAAVVLGILGTATPSTLVTLVALGLLALELDAFRSK
jgi:hypothetical protein